MQKIYWKSTIGNFGDDLNRDFFELATNLELDKLKINEAILGIGSILNYNTKGYDKIHVLGSGSGVKSLNIPNRHDYRFWFVRGPMTAKALGLDTHFALTDPAILIPEVYNIHPEKRKDNKALFIPHFISSENAAWGEACTANNILYRPATSKLHDICTDICRSEIVITESLHGAVLADSYRVPWILVATPPVAKSDFKWHDWAASLNLKYDYAKLPWLWTKQMSIFERFDGAVKYSLSRISIGPTRWTSKRFMIHGEAEIERCGKLLAEIATTRTPILSSEALFNDLKDRIKSKLNEFSIYANS